MKNSNYFNMRPGFILDKLLRNLLTYFLTGFITSVIAQFLLITALFSLIYVTDSKPNGIFADISFINTIWNHWFLNIAINTAIIYSLTLTIFRGYISPLIFMFVTLLYSAAIKYFTGNLLLGIAVQEYIYIIIFAMYVTGMTFFQAMLLGQLQSAITYRTTDDSA